MKIRMKSMGILFYGLARAYQSRSLVVPLFGLGGRKSGHRLTAELTQGLKICLNFRRAVSNRFPNFKRKGKA